MRILHTSDLHLSEDKQRTVDGFRAVLDIAKREKVDILSIGGDIFDSPSDADQFRPTLRALFDDMPFSIVAIPGNHDGSIFTRGYDFGFPVLAKQPYEEVNIGDVTFVAVPYSDILPEDLLPSIKNAALSSPQRILLLHCTLDIGFDISCYGDDEARRYFPVSRAALAELGYDFVLAGHFHTTCQVIPLNEKCSFVYPGSPVSITTKETGRRYAVLIDTSKHETSKIALPTFYYDTKTVEVTLGQDAGALEDVKAWCQERKDDNCEMEITVRGMIRRDENGFKKDLQKAIPETAKLNYEVKDVREVLKHPLYTRFKDLLKASVDESESDKVDQLVLSVMSSLVAGGELE